jgi:ATP-binding cassette subfamily F protein 3
VLILEEPTNHLDIQSKGVLKQALKQYEGTFIIVSHDREFLDGLTNRIWDIENKHLKIHHYTVQEYLQRKSDGFEQAQQVGKSKKQKVVEEKKSEPKNQLSYQEKKAHKREVTVCKNAVNKSEKKIEELESKIAEMDKVIASLDYSDEEKSANTLKEYETLKQELEETMSVWEENTIKIEELKEVDV